jgi:dUTP pyrophosphatase
MATFDLMKIKIINNSPFELPQYQTVGSSGLDIRANIEKNVVLEPMDRKLIKTGIFLEMSGNLECQIRPRSGLAFKKGITVLNSPGTIDADYRGELGVLLINLSNEAVTIEHGERIAQIVFMRVEKIDFVEVEKMEDSERGSGGFGSTGTK